MILSDLINQTRLGLGGYLEKSLKNKDDCDWIRNSVHFPNPKRIPMTILALRVPWPVSLGWKHAHIPHFAFSFPKLGGILSCLPGSVPAQLIASSCFKFPLRCLSKAVFFIYDSKRLCHVAGCWQAAVALHSSCGRIFVVATVNCAHAILNWGERSRKVLELIPTMHAILVKNYSI